MSVYETPLWCFRIEVPSGAVLRFCEYPHAVPMSNGDIYISGTGFQFSGFEQGNGTSPPTIDLKTFMDVGGITEDQIQSGYFDNARGYLFLTSWAEPVVDDKPMMKFLFGKTSIEDDTATIEMMALIDALNQTVGLTVSPACYKTFCGQEAGGCTLDIIDYQYPFTITQVDDEYTFYDSDLYDSSGPISDDFFSPGRIVFTTGDNINQPEKHVQSYRVSDGRIEIFDPFHFPVQVGDQGVITRWCTQKMDFCKAEGNILNFGGHAFCPTEEDYNASLIGTTG